MQETAGTSTTTNETVLRHSSIIENAPYLLETDAAPRLVGSSSGNSNGSSALSRTKQ
jgi:hypothetical protein